MAWLKFDVTTPEKPEVLAITIALGWEDPDLTVGKLLKVWRWFDQHTVEGNALGVTAALLDRLIGVTGLTQAMANVGWLVITPSGLTLPNFETHNGKTAKDRALTASRVANHKTNAKGNAPTVSDALPREEKRREEKEEEEDREKPAKRATSLIKPESVSDQTWTDWLQLRKTKKAPVTQTVINGAMDESVKAGMSLEDFLQVWCRRGSQGLEASWLKSDERPQTANKQQALEQRNRTVAQRWANGGSLPGAI